MTDCELCEQPLGDGWCSACAAEANARNAETTGTIGPLRYRLGAECGDLFEEGDDFDGLTLTVEVRSMEEGRRMIEALREVAP